MNTIERGWFWGFRGSLGRSVMIGCLLCCGLIGCAEMLSPPGEPGAAPQKVQAKGYGMSSTPGGFITPEGRLAAMRAARIDAYRVLAEQVYGVRIISRSSLNAAIAKEDAVRAETDTFLRGARIVSVEMQADGTCEAVAEIDWPVALLEAPAAGVAPAADVSRRSRDVAARCMGLGCAQAGTAHYSKD